MGSSCIFFCEMSALNLLPLVCRFLLKFWKQVLCRWVLWGHFLPGQRCSLSPAQVQPQLMHSQVPRRVLDPPFSMTHSQLTACSTNSPSLQLQTPLGFLCSHTAMLLLPVQGWRNPMRWVIIPFLQAQKVISFFFFLREIRRVSWLNWNVLSKAWPGHCYTPFMVLNRWRNKQTVGRSDSGHNSTTPVFCSTASLGSVFSEDHKEDQFQKKCKSNTFNLNWEDTFFLVIIQFRYMSLTYLVIVFCIPERLNKS